MNASDVINFSISTMASEATHATHWKKKKKKLFIQNTRAASEGSLMIQL